MQISKISSERLSMLRFPLIIGVVFIHTHSIDDGLTNGVIGVANIGYLIDFCHNIISQGMARVAVPLFFLMSGYFFFLGLSFSLANYKIKMKSRLKTLLIPFLFWNILTLCLIALAQYLPATQTFFSGKNDPISSFGVIEYINALFGIGRSPISYQFWFIRDLMVMVLFAPVVHLLLSTASRIVLLSLFSLWFLDVCPIDIPSVAALLFFYFGAYLAKSNANLFFLDRFGPFILFLYLIMLLIDVSTKQYFFNSYIHKVGIILGLNASLYVTSLVAKIFYLKKFLLWSSGCSFFVFAVHEPLLTVINKVSYKVFQPGSELSVLSLYFIVPIFVIACSMFAYVGIKSIAPKFLSVISGGR